MSWFSATLGLGVGLSFACAAGSAGPPISTSQTPERVAAHPPAPVPQPPARPQPPLRVGSSGDYAPFSSRDGTPELVGFDVELAEQLARALGRDIEWVTFRWPTLSAQIQAGDFDVAMSGVTWQPARAVIGYMTRAVARGGPCVLGEPTAGRIGVNRGGVLEVWARGRFGDPRLVIVDDNQSLPDLLQSSVVGAIVTDSFERRAFERPGFQTNCEKALSRKVYWVAPAHAAALGPAIDAWLRENTASVQAAQGRWFGERQELDGVTHLVDLLARRMAFMPLVAGLKARRGLPIEDLPRERELLAEVASAGERRALPPQHVRDYFELLLKLSKAVQRRTSETSELDLVAQIRPALDHLGERILDALQELRAEARARDLTLEDFELLSPWLNEAERGELLNRSRALVQRKD